MLCMLILIFMRMAPVRSYTIYGLSLKSFLSKFLVFKAWQRDKKYFATSAQSCTFPQVALVFSGSCTSWLINDHRGAIRPGRYRLRSVAGWTLIAVLGTLRRKRPYSFSDPLGNDFFSAQHKDAAAVYITRHKCIVKAHGIIPHLPIHCSWFSKVQGENGWEREGETWCWHYQVKHHYHNSEGWTGNSVIPNRFSSLLPASFVEALAVILCFYQDRLFHDLVPLLQQ